MKKPKVDEDAMLKELGAVASFAMSGPQGKHLASKEANQHGSEEAGSQASQPASQLAGEPASKPIKKFSTWLKPQTIKRLKRVAFEAERKDYEVVQEALDQYLDRVAGPVDVKRAS
jgi:hypothetical protein